MARPSKKIQEEIKTLAAKGLEVWSDESQPMAERKEVGDQIGADIKKLQDEHDNAKHVEGEYERLQDILGTPPEQEKQEQKSVQTDAEARSIGRQFTEDDNVKALMSKNGKSVFSTGAVEIKDITEAGSLTGTPIPPQYRPGILPILFRRMVVADLMPSIQVSSTVFRYVKENVATNNAATVAEGAIKPASDLTFATVDENVRKIASVMTVSDEIMEDFNAIRGYIDVRLSLFIQLTEETQLLSGDGTGQNLTGLLNRSGLSPAQPRGTDSRADAIFKEVTKIRSTAFLEPDAIVVNPTDWQTLRLEKDANGQYYAGGPFVGAYGNGNPVGMDVMAPSGPNYWGLNVVVTPQITAGTALVGAFAQSAMVLRRSPLTLEATNSHSTYFQYNLVMIRAEERLGLAVVRPSGFGTVTGL